MQLTPPPPPSPPLSHEPNLPPITPHATPVYPLPCPKPPGKPMWPARDMTNNYLFLHVLRLLFSVLAQRPLWCFGNIRHRPKDPAKNPGAKTKNINTHKLNSYRFLIARWISLPLLAGPLYLQTIELIA